MQCRHGVRQAALEMALGLCAALAFVAPLRAQVGGKDGAPWRGAGEQPCFGSDGGAFKCPPPPELIAVRAGRLFDSKSGRMLTRQVVLIDGERITEVGPEGQVKIPPQAQVIDFSQVTVAPGLIDAHTHMFIAPKPGLSRETSTLIESLRIRQQEFH